MNIKGVCLYECVSAEYCWILGNFNVICYLMVHCYECVSVYGKELYCVLPRRNSTKKPNIKSIAAEFTIRTAASAKPKGKKWIRRSNETVKWFSCVSLAFNGSHQQRRYVVITHVKREAQNKCTRNQIFAQNSQTL